LAIARKAALPGPVEAVVLAACTCVVGRVIAYSSPQIGTGRLFALAFDRHVHKIDRRMAWRVGHGGGEKCETARNTVALKPVVKDRNPALLQGAATHIGRFVFRSGIENRRPKTGAQAAFGRNFGNNFRIGNRDFAGGFRPMRKGLTGPVDGRRNHFPGKACGEQHEQRKGH